MVSPYEGEPFRQQFSLEADELTLSGDDLRHFKRNEQYNELMAPMQEYIGEVLTGSQMRYYEADSNATHDGSKVRALVAPYNHFFVGQEAWRASAAPLARFIVTREVSSKHAGHTVLTCSDYVVDANSRAMNWRERDMLVASEGGKPVRLPADGVDAPCIFNVPTRGEQPGQRQSARLVMFISRMYENEFIHFGFQPGAAKSLTEYSYVMTNPQYELPIRRKLARYQR